MLEIDIDGVFMSLLLLKKKKYAAVVVDNISEIQSNWNTKPVLKKEIKGLDMVRRDWCNLSKDASKVILDHILSGDNKDDIISNIHTYLHDLGKRINENKITLNKYIITKKLTKSVNDYPDGKS